MERLAPEGRHLLATFTDDVVPQEAVSLQNPLVAGIQPLLAAAGGFLLGQLAKLGAHGLPVVGDDQCRQADPP